MMSMHTHLILICSLISGIKSLLTSSTQIKNHKFQVHSSVRRIQNDTCILSSASVLPSDNNSPEHALSRKGFIDLIALQIIHGLINQPVNAQVTDESRTFFANTAADANKFPSSYLLSNPVGSDYLSKEPTKEWMDTTPSDEITISIPYDDIESSLKEGGLGIELADIEFRTNRRVFVKSVRLNSLASKIGIQRDWIVVTVNKQSIERTNAQGAALIVSRAMKTIMESKNTGTFTSLDITFRDPFVFQQRLNNLSNSPSSSVTTQVAPAGDTTQRNLDGSIKAGNVERSQTNQRVTVSQLIPPKLCTRGAQIDDLLEISYLGTVVETGEVFDGSAIKINGQGIPGRGNDVSLFFVLGKQPFGQFPPGWDVGLVGICVGERRRLILPPALAYGSTGVPRRNIPPNATLQYDVTLVSLNGLAIPQ